MAAPKGNRFWELRSKHGRDRLFATPALLWGAAVEYFTWCQSNPWHKVEQLKKPTTTKDSKGRTKLHTVVEIPTERPFTYAGLCNYLGCSSNYFSDFKANIKKSDPDDEQGFTEILTRIDQVMYQQKFEGAAVGAFNASIIARDLGLADKKEIAQTVITVDTQDDDDPDINFSDE